MNRNTRSLIVILTMVCSSALLAAEEAAKPDWQPADVVKAAITEKTDCGVAKATGTVAGEFETCIYYKADGTMAAKAGQTTSGGTYEIKDDGSLCKNWSNRYWEGSCAKRYPDASGMIIERDTGNRERFRVKQTLDGNARGL